MIDIEKEVRSLADDLRRQHMISRHDPHVCSNMAESYAAVGKDQSGDTRRKNLMRAAAWSLLALEAHDAEAAKAGS